MLLLGGRRKDYEHPNDPSGTGVPDESAIGALQLGAKRLLLRYYEPGHKERDLLNFNQLLNCSAEVTAFP